MTIAARRGLLLGALVAVPPLVGIGYSMLAAFGLAGTGSATPGTTALVATLGDRQMWTGLGWSLWVATAATTIAWGGAMLVALAFRGATGVDRFGRLVALIPLAVPHVVAAFVGVQLLGQSGLLARIGHAVGVVATPAAMPVLVYDHVGIGLIVVVAWKELPFLLLIAMAALGSRTARLEEAAQTLGATPVRVFRAVTWPILWRGMLPGLIAVFIFVVGNYEMAALLAPSNPMALPLQLFERATQPDLTQRAEAHVLVLVATLLAVLAVVAHEVARQRAERLTP